MLLFIIMIVVVSLILGPVMMMRPNSVQKKKEDIRIKAAAKGIRISMKNLPQQLSDSEKPSPTVVYYYPPINDQCEGDWMFLRTSYEQEIHFLGWWAWQGELRDSESEMCLLKEYLPQFPEFVRGVSLGSQGVCVYWYERANDEVSSKIIKLLESLKDLQKPLG